MVETDWGRNWVLFWWAWPCSVNLESNFLLMDGVVFPPCYLPGSKLWWTSLVAQPVKHLPTMWETRVQSLGWEDPLEKEMATHSSTLAWKIPWTEKPGRLQSMGSQRVGPGWVTLLTQIIKKLSYMNISWEMLTILLNLEKRYTWK